MNYSKKSFAISIFLSLIIVITLFLVYSASQQKRISQLDFSAPPTSLLRPSASPTPLQTFHYTNDIYKYQIVYPSDWRLTVNDKIITLAKGTDAEIIIDPTNPLKVVLPIINWVKKSNKDMDSDPNINPAVPRLLTLEDDKLLKDINGVVILDDSFFGQGGKTYLFSKNNTIFTISADYYYDDSTPNESLENLKAEIDDIVKTFAFSTTNIYTCPTSEWVDCLPSPDSPAKAECQKDFLDWATKNCPNFKGAAL